MLPWFAFQTLRRGEGRPWRFSGKQPTCHAGDMSWIPGLGRSPGGGNDNPLQCSCLGNPMATGTWWAMVYGVTKESDRIQPPSSKKQRDFFLLRTSHPLHHSSLLHAVFSCYLGFELTQFQWAREEKERQAFFIPLQ